MFICGADLLIIMNMGIRAVPTRGAGMATLAALLCWVAFFCARPAQAVQGAVPAGIDAAPPVDFVARDFRPALEFWVDAVSGDDSNDGTDRASAFASLWRAAEAVRAAGRLAGGVAVNVLPGVFQSTTPGRLASPFVPSPLELGAPDSGSAESPVVWRGVAEDGVSPARAGDVVLSAGVGIPATAWNKYSGRLTSTRGVWSVNLRSLGVNDFGFIQQPDGLGGCNNTRLNFFYDQARATLARWPNIAVNGSWMWAHVGLGDDVPENLTMPADSFIFNGTRPLRWLSRVAPEEVGSSPWVHGYFRVDWSDVYAQVLSIQRNGSRASLLTVNASTPMGNVLQNGRFMVVNAISELDAPGEYFVDDVAGELLFIPPTSEAPDSSGVVSVGDTVLSIDGASYINVTGLTLQHTRDIAVSATNVKHVYIVNCTATLHGGHGISVQGTSSGVVGCTLSDLGCVGLSVTGGDQVTLSPGHMLATRNSITRFSQHKRTYNPGLHWAGVNNTYSWNTIAWAPHAGVLGGGNAGGSAYCLHEHNHLHDLAFETSDTGAFYTCGQAGQGWINRGNVIRFCHFESIRNTEPVVLGYPSVQAIYLDDSTSGYEVTGNSFSNCQIATFVGGGRRNIITDNWYNYSDVSVHVDARGLAWANYACQVPSGSLYQGLLSVNFLSPPWSVHFPELVSIPSNWPCAPVFNRISGNSWCPSRLPVPGGNGTRFDNFTDFSDEVGPWLEMVYDNSRWC